MTASEMFKFVAERNKGKSITDTVAEIRKLESLLHAISEIGKRRAASVKKHHDELQDIDADMHILRTKCPHDWHRACAEADTVCSICGITDDDERYQ